jgi:hypothetical protein
LAKVVQLDYMYVIKLIIIVKLISQKICVLFKPMALVKMYMSISQNNKLVNLNFKKNHDV